MRTSATPYGRTNDVDVAIVGAGHNGLVAATFLARRGLKWAVFEAKPTVGGAATTEYPFGLGAEVEAEALAANRRDVPAPRGHV